MKKFAIIAAVLFAAPAMAVDFHGYWRESAGGNGAGGEQVQMDNAGFGANHLRLGNEGNYNELLFEQQVLKDKNGVEWTTGVMFGLGTSGYDLGFTGSVHVEQFYLKAKFPQLNGATVWAGSQYYHRQDNGIFDYQMLDPHRRGAGIENYDVGFGKLSVSVFKVAGAVPTVAFWDPDVRLEGIAVNPGGTLDVGAIGRIRTWNKDQIGSSAPSDTESFSPFLFAIHRQSGIVNGGNTFMVSYRTGCFVDGNAYTVDGGTGAASVLSCAKNTSRIIASDALLLQPSKTFGVTLAGVYARDQVVVFDGGSTKTGVNSISVAARPVFQLADHFAIQGDLGYLYSKIDKKDGIDVKASTMIKGTIAPTIIPWTDDFVAGVGPQIRFYVTYASWNKEQAGAHAVAKADAKNGLMFGVQAEAGF